MSERRADVFVDLESDPRSEPPTFVHLVPERVKAGPQVQWGLSPNVVKARRRARPPPTLKSWCDALLQRVTWTSAGNPFLAIEIAEVLVGRGSRPAPGDPVLIPEDARAVVEARIEALSTYAQDALGVCALSARPTVDVVSSVIGPRRARGGLREAADAGVVEVNGGELAFAHPLLTAAAYNWMTLAKRRPLTGGLPQRSTIPSSGDDISPWRPTGRTPLFAAPPDPKSLRVPLRGRRRGNAQAVMR